MVLALTAEATPLVYDGQEALQQALELSDAPTEDHRPFTDVRAMAPAIVEGGEVLTCAGEAVSAADLGKALETASSRLLYGEYSGALDALNTAPLECLSDPVEPDMLSSWWVHAGAAHAGTDNLTAARRAFLAARVASPHVTLPDSHGADVRTLFDEAVPEMDVQLRAVAPAASVHVDGIAATEAKIGAGPHLVQAGEQSLVVELGASNSATLVVPGAYTSDTIDDVGAHIDDLSPLMSLVAGEGQSFWLATKGSGVWKGSAGRTDWEQLAAPAPAIVETTGETPEPAPAEPPKDKPSMSTGATLIAFGGLMTVTGGALSTVHLLETGRARSEYETTNDSETAREMRARFEDARHRFAGTRWITIAGGALTATGIVLHITRPVQATVTPGGVVFQGRF